MDNIILRTTVALIWRLLLAYSVYVLLRGHNEPGGGFIGGLLLALAIILRGHISKHNHFTKALARRFTTAVGVALIVFISVILLPSLFGMAALTGLWTSIWVPIAGKFSSVLVFDVVVYVVVAISAVYAHHALSISHSDGHSDGHNADQAGGAR